VADWRPRKEPRALSTCALETHKLVATKRLLLNLVISWISQSEIKTHISRRIVCRTGSTSSTSQLSPKYSHSREWTSGSGAREEEPCKDSMYAWQVYSQVLLPLETRSLDTMTRQLQIMTVKERGIRADSEH